jgi:hypothetical protein
MVHQLTYQGEPWRVETVGGSHDGAGIRSVGVLFVHEPTGHQLLGSLNPADVGRPTDARLTEALASAIGALRANAPRVYRHDVGSKIGFMIIHSMYRQSSRDPELAHRPGYVSSHSYEILDEPTTRRALSKFFGWSDADIDARLRDAARAD